MDKLGDEKAAPPEYTPPDVYVPPMSYLNQTPGIPLGLLEITSWGSNVKIVCKQSLIEDMQVFTDLRQAMSRKQGVKPQQHRPMSDGFTTFYYTTEGRSFTREQIAHHLFVGGWKSYGFSCTYHDKAELVYFEKWARYG